MAIKKLTLTEDHLKLIRAIKFDTFTFGEKFDTTKIDEAIDDVRYEYEENDRTELGTVLQSLLKADSHIKRFSSEAEHYAIGVDAWSLWGGNYVYEDIARLIGKDGEALSGTTDITMGNRYPKELEDYMAQLYIDIYDNLALILQLVMQFSTEGGLTPGTYKCIDYEGIWTKIS